MSGPRYGRSSHVVDPAMTAMRLALSIISQFYSVIADVTSESMVPDDFLEYSSTVSQCSLLSLVVNMV